MSRRSGNSPRSHRRQLRARIASPSEEAVDELREVVGVVQQRRLQWTHVLRRLQLHRPAVAAAAGARRLFSRASIRRA